MSYYQEEDDAKRKDNQLRREEDAKRNCKTNLLVAWDWVQAHPPILVHELNSQGKPTSKRILRAYLSPDMPRNLDDARNPIGPPLTEKYPHAIAILWIVFEPGHVPMGNFATPLCLAEDWEDKAGRPGIKSQANAAWRRGIEQCNSRQRMMEAMAKQEPELEKTYESASGR